MDGAGVKLVHVIRTNGLKPKKVIEGDPGMPLRGRYYSWTLAMAHKRGGEFRGAREGLE